MCDSCLQVLPLSEEPRSDRTDDLLQLEDVRVEVMRSRGAGGQVRLRIFFLPFLHEEMS
jgi:protein subunit release factor A